MQIYLMLFFFLLTVLGYWHVYKTEKQDQFFKKKSQLIKLCRGNIAKAKRLVSEEFQRKPGISMGAALDNAILLLSLSTQTKN
ncbi:hypothetical protein [Aliikangiella maris]|uniref:Uncharacterized protein n=2 Tax=Aliikangiella maris TaxID=3162458 RepID=A0ABV3MSR2_9GAMM